MAAAAAPVGRRKEELREDGGGEAESTEGESEEGVTSDVPRRYYLFIIILYCVWAPITFSIWIPNLTSIYLSTLYYFVFTPFWGRLTFDGYVFWI